jgi:hypothetical protein
LSEDRPFHHCSLITQELSKRESLKAFVLRPFPSDNSDADPAPKRSFFRPWQPPVLQMGLAVTSKKQAEVAAVNGKEMDEGAFETTTQ